MKEPITLQKLVQEGWVPLLTGILSASVILSLAHTNGMGYVAALLLMMVYFAVISANLVDAAWAAAVKKLQQLVISRFRALFFMPLRDCLRARLQSLGLGLLDLYKRRSEQVMGALSFYRHNRVPPGVETVLMNLLHSIDDLSHGRTHFRDRSR